MSITWMSKSRGLFKFLKPAEFGIAPQMLFITLITLAPKTNLPPVFIFIFLTMHLNSSNKFPRKRQHLMGPIGLFTKENLQPSLMISQLHTPFSPKKQNTSQKNL